MKSASALLPRLEAIAFRAAAAEVTRPEVDLAITSRRLERPNRACIETNLGRKGLWQVGVGSRRPRESDGASSVDSDQLGYVARIDTGPRLGVLALELMVWLCSRWKELDDPDARRVPLTLEGIAADLGWSDGGHNRKVVAQTMDALRTATFKARIWDARSMELRLQTFGLVDRWEAGLSRRVGHCARAGFAVLGDCLLEQLRIGCVTHVDWERFRELSSPTATRLYLYLEAERFPRDAVWSRPLSPELFASLGIDARRNDHARAGLRRGCEALSMSRCGYRVCVVGQAGGFALAATRD